MKKKKILLIDDYAPLLAEVSEFLEMEDYDIETAKNGAEGVQKAITYSPDMIICDILMPELNGYEVFDTISKIPSLSTVPFIFLTARATADDYRKGLELGIDDYVTKPFTIEKLLSTVKKRFEKVENYMSIRQNVVQFLFKNPMFGVFIYSGKSVVFINDKVTELTGYTLNDLNKLNFGKIIVGNISEIEKEVQLLRSGIREDVFLEIGVIRKDKQVISVKIFLEPIVFEGKNSFIGSVIQKEENNKTDGVTPDMHEFIEFINSANRKELSEEVAILYNQMKIENSIEHQKLLKKIKLSKREKEVLELICKGYTNKEIAEKLFLSNRTIDNHRANMLNKTKTKNTAELVAFVVKNRLVNI